MVMQERAVRTRQALIRAAAEVFASDGYARASLFVISKRAGVSSGALHFHFANKDALAQEVESEATNAMREMAEAYQRQIGSPLQCLVHTAFGLLRGAAEDPVVQAGFRLGSDPSRKSDAEIFRWWRGQVHELILQAQGEGELARDVSAEDATRAIVAATIGLKVVAMVDAEWPSVEGVARFWALILPWLAAAPERVLASVAHDAHDAGCTHDEVRRTA